jgi:uncharacterized RDD family membrane protein YckC
VSTKIEKSGKHRFCGHESPRLKQLGGQPLATFGQRLLGFYLDLILVVLIWFPLEAAWRVFALKETNTHITWDFHEPGNVLITLLYYGLFNYFGNGRTPGKWIARTRIVSLTRERMGFWQSIERALGYGAAVLEGGLGFLQYFWSENRMCAQDRLAETIVVDVRKRRQVDPASPLAASHD